MDMESKICKKCKQIKDLSLFYYRKKEKDGRCCYCKECLIRDRKNTKELDTKRLMEIYANNHDLKRNYVGEVEDAEEVKKLIKDYRGKKIKPCHWCKLEKEFVCFTIYRYKQQKHTNSGRYCTTCDPSLWTKCDICLLIKKE